MSIQRQRPLPTWQIWLRVVVTMAMVASAGAGLALGLALESPDPPTASRDWFATQAQAVGQRAFQHLALGQAQAELDRQAARVLDGSDEATSPVPFERYSLRLAGSARPSTSDLVAGEFRAATVIRYRLPVDGVTVGRAVSATFELGRDGWQLSSLGTDGRDLWEHESVQVASAGQSLVVGSSAYASRLPSLADQVEAARQQVRGFWSANWPGRVVVVLPGEARLMRPLVESASASRLLAVATSHRGPRGPVIRVTVNPDVFLGLPYISQQIVLRHEITHVAQDALAADRAPTWLVEGLAEYVGYLGAGVPDSIVGGGAFAAVRSNGVPAALPSDRAFDFDLSPGERSLAYERGWAACRMVVDSYGQDRLIPFFQAVVKVDGSESERIDQAARKVLGITGDAFVAQWQAWLLEHA